jgi:hypothetical protein
VLSFILHHQEENLGRPPFAKVQIKNDKKVIAYKQDNKKKSAH